MNTPDEERARAQECDCAPVWDVEPMGNMLSREIQSSPKKEKKRIERREQDGDKTRPVDG